MSEAARIVVVGSLNADLVVHAERFPQPGETLLGSELAVLSGGKGANQAVAAARLGGNVSMVGSVGADSHGDFLREQVRAAGVDVGNVSRTPGVATGTAVITVDASGENTIIVSPGANGTLDEKQIDVAADVFIDAAILCLCLEVGIDPVVAAARRARDAGAQVLLNLSPYGPVPDELLELTSILLVNEHEAANLAESGQTGWAGMADALRSRGIDRAVVTTGSAGAVVIDGPAEVVSVASPAVEAIDTTGCGDAFMGALAFRLANGFSLVDAAHFAATVGSYAATSFGAQSSYPTRQQLDQFLAG